MSVDERLDRIEQAMQAGFNQNRAEFDRLNRHLLQMRTEVIRQLELVDPRLDVPENAVSGVQSRMPVLSKAVIDLGTLAGQVTKLQPHPLDSSTDLAARLSKLDEQVAKLIDRAA